MLLRAVVRRRRLRGLAATTVGILSVAGCGTSHVPGRSAGATATSTVPGSVPAGSPGVTATGTAPGTVLSTSSASAGAGINPGGA